MKYTIVELVEKVNSLLDGSSVEISEDARVKVLTERRVRDYQTKRLISEPEKDGRSSYYTDVHLNQLIAIRELQKQGMSDSVLQKMSKDSYGQDANYKDIMLSPNGYVTSSMVSPDNSDSSSSDTSSNNIKRGLLDALASCVPSSEPCEKYNMFNGVAGGLAKSASLLVGSTLKATSQTIASNVNASKDSQREVDTRSAGQGSSVTLNFTKGYIEEEAQVSYKLSNEVTVTVKFGLSLLNEDEKKSLKEKFNEVLKNL